MSMENDSRQFSVDEAVGAQKALRQAAGLEPEKFPIEAFVGMISDEIDSLRKSGKNDEEIATLIRESSSIQITGDDISDHFVPAGERHPEAK